MEIPPARSLGLFLASRTGYPKPVRALINRSPVETTITAASTADIKRGCLLFGDVALAPETTVERRAELRDSVTLGRGVYVGRGTRLDGNVTVGAWTDLMANVEAFGEVDIGKYCAVARRSTFQGRGHAIQRACIERDLYVEHLGTEFETVSRGPIVVGNDVWIGVDTIFLSGVEVGHGAVVGAGSVVTKDVEPYSIVAGVPAEHRGYRFDEPVRSQLLDLGWWDWPIEKIKRNEQFFTTDLNEIGDLSSLLTE